VKLYNTESKTKTEFVPIDSNNITVYVCGPTVWNHAHIGNYRPPVVFDVLTRVLRAQYPKVKYARNITDIDDKINKAAAVEPKVTDHVAEIHQKIQALIDGDYAYVADNHVLFDVSSYSDYGQLSKRDPEELLAGARIDVASYKKSDGDFVLWKPSADDQPGWDSPWGRGRPGWHIECTAMAATHLGETIDIHGGGHDLVFPHHENERAQSSCAHGKEFVKYWMHNGFVNVNKEKMSKSIGNVLLVKDLLEYTSGEAIRYVLFKAGLLQSGEWLGLFQQDPEAWFSTGADDIDGQQIDALIAERLQAKTDKNWARADQIRDILADKKVVVEDGPDGTTWRIEK